MRRSLAVLLVALLGVLAGCTAEPGEPHAAAPSAPVAANPEYAAIDLINLWRVLDAPGESESTWLRLDAREYQLWRDRCAVIGSWTAGENSFLAGTYSASDTCGGSIPVVDWLDDVVGYVRDGEGWRLTDAAGTTLARLVIDGAPEPIPSMATFYTEPPVVGAEAHEATKRTAPMTAGLEPAQAADLVGRWVPTEQASAPAEAEFAATGDWTGDDGCNGMSGRWLVDRNGELLTTSGFTTLVGCDGVAASGWVAWARHAAFDGAQLVLFDRYGDELGRLVRG